MSKIKKIEISDFRIYEGKEDFNFEGDNGVSNLVALYAPNGYGKTSFFDAVEWGFSDEIKRFENNFIKKAIKDEREDTILLTNSNSYKNGLKGKVKILIEEDFFLEKTVQKYKKPGTLFYNDYRQGVLSQGAISVDLREIPETNILTQDQIDAFLRFKTPEEKFAALQEFWPQSEDATIRLKQLSELHKVLLKNLNDTQSRLKHLTDSLQELTKDNRNILKINLWLQKVKVHENCNFSIDKIDQGITQEIYNIIYDENSRNIKRIILEIDKAELIRSELNIIHSTLDNYLSDSRKIKNVNKKLIQLQNRKSNFLNLKKSKELQRLTSDEIVLINQGIDKYKYIELNVLDYKSDIENIEKLKIENQISINQNAKVLDHIQIIKESISNFRQHETRFNQAQLDKEKQQSNVDRQYDEYLRISEKIKEQKKNLSELELKISFKQTEIEKFQKGNQELNKVVEKENYSTTILSEDQNYLQLSVDLIRNTELINKLKLDVTLKQEGLDKTGSLNENLDKIILFGEDYITKTNSSDCPLCKTTFKTFEALIESVKLDKKDILKLSEQQNEVSKVIDDISELQKNRVILIEKINKAILFKKEEISKNIVLAQDEKNNLVNQNNDINNAIRILEYELKDCSDFFNKIFDDALMIERTKIDSLKNDLNERILGLKAKKERLKIIIHKKEQILKQKEIILLTNKSRLDKNKNSIELIQSQEIYQKTVSLINEFNLNNSQLDKTLVEDLIILAGKELLNKSEALALISNELKSIGKKITDDEIQIDEANLEGNISENESFVKTYKENIEAYTTKFSKYILSQEINEVIIKDHQFKNQETLDNLLNQEKDLTALNIDLELIKENIKRNELEKEVEILNSKHPRLTNSEKKIKAAKMDCMSYIQEGINNYFNKEVINEVYRRIEPHPKLTRIDFKTDFNDKGEPRLLIKTGNNKNEDGVNPILFLSAGQVNVLSLSIFLAKAFEYGNKTIETIFMDDPIQNLSDINVLSFIDLLRTLISVHDKQIVISTHDEKFFRLLQNKLPEEYCNTKYLEFESEGKLKKDIICSS